MAAWLDVRESNWLKSSTLADDNDSLHSESNNGYK
jgi:hypothetical protein